MGFYMLLANEFQELSHLLGRGFFTILVIFTAGAVSVMLFIVRRQQIRYDGLELWSQMLLRADKFQGLVTIFLDNLFDIIGNRVIIFLGVSFLDASLEIHCAPHLESLLLLNGEQLLLMYT